MLKGWNNMHKYVCVCKLSLCVLLQDDQSTPWLSMKNQMEDGSHTYLLNTEHLETEKKHTVRKG